MIVASYRAALGQLAEPGFRRLLLLGMALNLALLAVAYALFLWLAFGGDGSSILTIPFAGEVTGLGVLLSPPGLLYMLAVSTVLMIPVTSAFTGLFLGDVAVRVEARHYPGLGPVRSVPAWDAFVTNVNLLGLLLVANAVGIAAAAVAGPPIPLVFWLVNGVLLGREFFLIAALRRHRDREARRLWQHSFWRATGAGLVLVTLLLMPVVNLAAPVVAAAAYAHLVARVTSGRTGPDRRR